MTVSLNPYHCPAMEHGMYLERYTATHSKIAPCCAAVTDELTPNEHIDFNTNPFLIRLREENQQGSPSAECNVCYRNEHFTGHSLRTSLIDFYSHNFHLPTGLVNLDFNVDPICNAKCIICSQTHSSAWLAEDLKFGYHRNEIIRTLSSSRANTIVETIDLSNLQRIYFNGGEPVLSDDPIKLLSKLDEIERIGEVILGFNMNGSTPPTAEFVALMKKVKKVNVFFSIDGVGEQFEYIRNPLKWNDLLKTIEYIIGLDIKDLTVWSTYTVGVHNIDYINDWYTWWHHFTSQLVSKLPVTKLVKIDSIYQLCIGEFDIKDAPTSIKTQWIDYLQQFTDKPWYPLVIGAIKEPADQTRQPAWPANPMCIEKLNQLDLRRGNSWHHSLSRFYQRCIDAGLVK